LESKENSFVNNNNHAKRIEKFGEGGGPGKRMK
jgi:hypothetical protein